LPHRTRWYPFATPVPKTSLERINWTSSPICQLMCSRIRHPASCLLHPASCVLPFSMGHHKFMHPQRRTCTCTQWKALENERIIIIFLFYYILVFLFFYVFAAAAAASTYESSVHGVRGRGRPVGVAGFKCTQVPLVCST